MNCASPDSENRFERPGQSELPLVGEDVDKKTARAAAGELAGPATIGVGTPSVRLRTTARDVVGQEQAV